MENENKKADSGLIGWTRRKNSVDGPGQGGCDRKAREEGKLPTGNGEYTVPATMKAEEEGAA
jgi:hypothetical protein